MTDTYDSTADTLKHALRVGELMGQPIHELVDRSVRHDRSKTEEPELAIFNEFTPKLKASTYCSEEYKGFLAAMGEGLAHHYRTNQHHPEHVDRDIEWRPVEGFEGYYEVSNLGDIRSVTREILSSGRASRVMKGQPMATHINAFGYPRLQLARDGKKTNVFLHVLVAQAFVPNPSDKPEVNHRDGNKLNNAAANLEWSTRCENNQHAHDIGLNPSPAKYVIHCPEYDLTTLGAYAMERELRKLGIETQAAGVYRAAVRGGSHKNLQFESYLLAEYRRSQINGMTLVDLIEMLADWRAATERHADGSLVKSLAIQKERFGISDQLTEILWNTARHFRWLDNQPCGDKHTAPDGTRMVCNVPIDRPEGHDWDHADGRFDGGQYTWR